MGTQLRVLLVEDSKDDTELITLELQRYGYDVKSQRVQMREAFCTALADHAWDVVIADYSLPAFSGLDALAIVREREPDLPFIILSDVTGEDIAVSGMKAGAYDYVMKDDLARLAPAVERALHEAERRRAHRKAEEALQESEGRYRLLAENVTDVIWTTDLDLQFTYVSPSVTRMLGYSVDEAMALPLEALLAPDSLELATEAFQEELAVEYTERRAAYKSRALELEIYRKDGATVWVEIRTTFLHGADDRPTGLLGVARDVTERKRTEEALKLNLEQLAALSRASQTVTASLELDQVLSEIISLASEVVASDYTSVVLMDEGGNIRQSAENLLDVPTLEYRLRTRGLTNWIVHSRQPVIVDEIGEDGAMRPALGGGAPALANPVIVEAGVKSVAGLPLVAKGHLLGVLYLHSLRTDAFHDRMPLLTTFANQVAIAVENARLFQAQQQQSQKLALAADVARIAATTLDADALLQAIAESIHQRFGYPVVALFTPDRKGTDLILRGYSGIEIGVEASSAGDYRQPREVGIVGYVARTGKSYIVPDVGTDPYFFRPAESSVKSALCIPVRDEDRVVGIIDVESDQLDDFDSQDLSLLEAVADTVAIGLRNARLYQETQYRLRELTLLNRISVGYGVVLDMDTLIEGTLEGLEKLVGADCTFFVTIDPIDRTWEVTYERAASGLEPGLDLKGSFEDAPIELQILSNDQPFAVFDVAFDPRTEATREMYDSVGAQSLLMVPVQVEQQLYGVLGFTYCREKHAWEPDEIRLLEGVAHQLQLAMENVHFFEEVQLRADELAAALARLEEMDRLKDQFIQNVSHELRSPLALIRGYAEMLDTGELGDLQSTQQKPVAVIARRARMLSDLVQDITLILEAGINPPKPEPVFLEELTRNAVEDFEVVVEQAGLALNVEIAPDLPPVSGSFTYVRRILDNLLGNAVKFTPAGGEIAIQVEQREERVALAVSDTGIGIPVDKLERVFDRFYQVDGSARRRYGGVGLGLALVKEIVEAYQGEVKVESQVGQGTTFTVLLPVFTDTEAPSDQRYFLPL